ncbi:MAG TPA: ATP-dependent DNA ligase [Sorangium sp.]|nr:ATP-dependent DNA ligase [Sorangium sp.]
MATKYMQLELAGRTVRISSPDKVFFSQRGETKLDLINYYRAVEQPLLAATGGRPTMLRRFPNGASGKGFFQKRITKGAPPWLQTTTVSTPNGTTSNAMVIADIAHVAWAAHMGCLGFHVWPYQAAAPEVCDELRIDLDRTSKITFDAVRAAARKVHLLLRELNIVSYVKTTGSKGLHIYVRLMPRWDAYQVRAAAVALARELARRHPDELTAKWWKEERGDRVFIDYNQNAPHKTIFGAWSVRARVGAQVSTPIRWDELPTIVPDELTIKTVPARLAALGNPWETMNDAPQSLQPLLLMYQRDMDNGCLDAPWPPQYPKQPNEPPRVAPSRAKKG